MKSVSVLVIGGGNNQVPLVIEAKSRGLSVLVTDININPPCRSLADNFFQVDTTDRARTLEIAKAHRIAAVVTDQSDVAVPTAAYVAEHLKLPGIGFETSLRFTNKHVMRTVLQLSDPDLLPQSWFFQDANKLSEHLNGAKTILTELLVKPINSQGSKGVSRLLSENNQIRISSAFREARGHGVLLESFVAGDEFSVEAFVVGGHVTNLAVTRKFHFPQNDCIDFRNTYLGDVSNELQQLLYEANSRVIKSLGLATGSTHAEFKTDGQRVYLIEIAARGGGGNISGKIIPYLTGFSPTKSLLDFALGEKPNVVAQDYRNRFAIMRFFDFSPGTVFQISKEINWSPEILHFELNLKEGDVIRPVASSRDRVGYFIVSNSDRKEVLKLEDQVLQSVQVKYLTRY